ncbi:MAG: Omp28-related outer membrane protein [Lentimicrobiaceae bacterium]
MRKIFTLLVLSVCFTFGLSAQVLVGTNPMHKNAILEEFTGIHCGYCPDGHAIAQSIIDNNPGRAFTIALHQGSFASPATGEPDYRTIFGDPLANQTGLTGYPSGTVNRHLFSGSATALGRGAWSAACDQIMKEVSPVNIGISSQYEASTRQLTIQVELYYTSNAITTSNFINVALTQDSIYGPQTNGGAGNNYRHMHMLRHMITGQWGDEVTTTTLGSIVSRTYTYTVPEAYNNIPAVVENMKVVAFVTKDHQEIYTGDQVNAINGTNLFIGEIASQEPYIQKGSNGAEQVFNLEAISNIAGTESFDVWIESENAPSDWQASFMIDGLEYTGHATVNMTKDIVTPITVNVIPGASAGFPGYVIRMKSITNPTAPEKMYRVMVVAGVTDLLVNGTGGPETVNNQGAYLDGLAASGITSYAVVNANVMRDMINANAFGNVFNCWLNIAWTFPALTDSQAEAIMAFMDAGHNVFIAGQDIGWDVMSGADGSNGTSITRNFYTNYLKAGFVDDGSSTNNKLNANTADPIFGAVPQSNIVDVYGGNMYPDVIKALPGADVIFNYTVATKTAAVKYDGVYRSIYFGVGLEMLGNVGVRNEIINLSREWLSAEMVGVEYLEAVNALLSGQNYPNPANDYTWFPVSKEAEGGTLEIYNMSGNLVLTRHLGSELLYRIDLSGLSSGIYTYRVVNGDKISVAHKLSLIK